MNNEKIEINMPIAPGIVFINGEPYKTEWYAEAALVEENMALRAELGALKSQNDILRAESEAMYRGVEVEIVGGEIAHIKVGDVEFVPSDKSHGVRQALLLDKIKHLERAYGEKREALEDLRAIARALNEKIDSLNTEKAVLDQRVRDADGTISRLHSKLSRQTDAYESLQLQLLQAQIDYKGVRDEVKRLREQLKQDRNAIRVELLDELHKQARAKLITETPIFRG